MIPAEILKARFLGNSGVNIIQNLLVCGGKPDAEGRDFPVGLLQVIHYINRKIGEIKIHN